MIGEGAVAREAVGRGNIVCVYTRVKEEGVP